MTDHVWSRSPSPASLESTSSDGPELKGIRVPGWYSQKLGQPDASNDIWSGLLTSPKVEEDSGMMRLDDLIQSDYAFNETSVDQENSKSEIHFIPDQLQAFDYPLTMDPTSASSPLETSRDESPHVIFPPKASCSNLPIMTPSIPKGGTKSRVETQVRVTMELAAGPSSEPGDPLAYDRVGSWKWLKLPPGTSTKRRNRKDGKIIAPPSETLYLSTNVICATPPNNVAVSCAGCQARETKRVQRKLAARVRPLPSDSESPESPSGSRRQQDDPTSIIQFNCHSTLPFDTGSVILPIRIICYCRHHREKTGFNVHFTMSDHTGRVVGSGVAGPIMITDDHKTVGAGARTHAQSDGPGAKRDQRKKRIGPYDVDPSSRGGSTRVSRAASVASFEGSHSSNHGSSSSRFIAPRPLEPIEPVETQIQVAPTTPQLSEGSSHSPSEAIHTPPDPFVNPPPLPFFFAPPTTTLPLPTPTIHRLIPAVGPTHGGIEITILGAGFHPSLQLSVVFGGLKASVTHRWSDNTLVCVLPPRHSAGVVGVWFDGVRNDTAPVSLFTYTDESDRALMELALQVVGLKMTGKIEDAKNVAMKIVGGNGDSQLIASNITSSNTHMAMSSNSSTFRALRPRLFMRAGEDEDFEVVLLDFLSVLDTASPAIPTTEDAISHTTLGGQTMLHLATALGFADLVQFLVVRGIDLDVRDRNGYTALHFAGLKRSKACAQALIIAGADVEIVNVLGVFPKEQAPEGFFDETMDDPASAAISDGEVDSEESQWGDVEEDEEEPLATRRSTKRNRERSHRRRYSSTDEIFQQEIVIDSVVTRKSESHTEKQFAFFGDLLNRTIAHITAQKLVPTAAWDALPQISAFPASVAAPGWPSFFAEKRSTESGAQVRVAAVQPSAEWRAIWDKWFDALVATTLNRQAEMEAPPPVYTPRKVVPERPLETSSSSSSVIDTASTSKDSTSNLQALPVRPLDWDQVPGSITEHDMKAYVFQAAKQKRNTKKFDKMLIYFWIPVLIVSLIWALYTGSRLAMRGLAAFPSVRTLIKA